MKIIFAIFQASTAYFIGFNVSAVGLSALADNVPSSKSGISPSSTNSAHNCSGVMVNPRPASFIWRSMLARLACKSRLVSSLCCLAASHADPPASSFAAFCSASSSLVLCAHIVRRISYVSADVGSTRMFFPPWTDSRIPIPLSSFIISVSCIRKTPSQLVSLRHSCFLHSKLLE